LPHRSIIFDRALLRDRQQRARALGTVTFLIDRVADDLADRLSAVTRRFELAADLGKPTPAVRRALAGVPSIGTLIAVGSTLATVAQDHGPKIVGDEETLPFEAASLDLIVSAMALQSVNDLPGTLSQIQRALKPDGLLLAALLGGESLTELRQAFAAAEAEIEGGASPRVAPFLSVREAGALLQRAAFALPVADIDRLTVRYSSAFDLMADLRRMGATNALVDRRREPLKRATLMRAVDIYAHRFADPDHRLRATFEIVWLSGWGPHHSQQQPLRPGSAKARLADALGVHEISAGDKATG
jgi:SAM-dependent methyltransferase